MFRYVVVCSTYEACQTNNNQNATGCLNTNVYQYMNSIVGLLKWQGDKIWENCKGCTKVVEGQNLGKA